MVRHLDLGLRVAAARLGRKKVPFFVQLAPTSACNLKCRYCFAEFHERDRRHFPYPALKQVVEGLADLGTRFVMLTGGEPMMYPQIIPLVQLISDRKIECLLNTNGTLVLDRIDDLAGVDIFSISLDGPRELNDYYRGSGVYDQVLKTVAGVRKRGKRVQIQYTMTRDLKKSFGHIHAIAQEYGCFIGINFLRPQQQASGEVIAPQEASREEILDFVDWLIRRRLPAVPYPPRLLRYARNWPFGFQRHLIPDRAGLGGFKPIPCAAGRFLIAIDHQGDIFPCTKHFYGLAIGNCADGDIRQAWNTLKPARCQACLDLGCNLLNFNIRFTPSALLGLSRVFFAR